MLPYHWPAQPHNQVAVSNNWSMTYYPPPRHYYPCVDMFVGADLRYHSLHVHETTFFYPTNYRTNFTYFSSPPPPPLLPPPRRFDNARPDNNDDAVQMNYLREALKAIEIRRKQNNEPQVPPIMYQGRDVLDLGSNVAWTNHIAERTRCKANSCFLFNNPLSQCNEAASGSVIKRVCN